MLNFASLFNQWRSQNNNGVVDMLDQPNMTMGRLLDQQSFQGEYKSGNPKVIEFMRYERYQELIEFVTVVGPAEDKKRSYKYPLSACEILSLQNTSALDFFVPDKPLTIDTTITQTEEVEVQVEVQVEAQESPQKQTQESPPQKKQEDQTEHSLQEQKEKPIETVTKDEGQVQILKEPAVKESDKSPQVQQEAKEQKKALAQEQLPKEQKKDVTEEQLPKEQKPSQTQSPKKTKKVLKKQIKTVQKIVKKQVPPLIHKLLSYFDEQVNYTLAGYVSKILTTLLNKRPAETMKYILNENIIHKIINHAQSRSVGDFIVKILTHQTALLLDLRRNFFYQLLDRTSTFSQIQVISNLSAYICEIIQKIAANLKGNNRIAQFNNVFFSLQTINQVIKNVMSDQQNVAVYNAPILLTYLTNVPFVLPEDQNIVQEFQKLGEQFIEKSCEKLQVDKSSKPKLGYGRIKLIEILKFVIKQNILNSKEIVAHNPKFFPILLNLVKQYDMNNVLHNEVIKIIEMALGEPADSPLNSSVLRDDILLNFILEEWEEDKRIKAGDSVYKFRKGYIAHAINLYTKLRELSESNQHIKTLIENPKLITTYETFIEKEIVNSKKSLAGLMMKKEMKHPILFQKQDIITAHLTFLQKCPNSIYQPEATSAQHINIEHPDLVEQLQKQLEENLVFKSVGKEEKQHSPKNEGEHSPKHEGEHSPKNEGGVKQTPEEIQNQGRYWATHLEYNIDELIADL